MANKTAIIIGGGIGGLSTASYLAKAGFKVTLFEKNQQVGGRAMVLKSKGFTFDMGPSWYLMPDIWNKFFKDFGYKTSSLLKLKRLKTNYRIFFDKNDFTDIKKDLKDNLKYFESLEPGSTPKILDYLKKSQYAYETSIKHFLYTSFERLSDFFKPKLLFEATKLKVFQSLESYTSSYFKSERLKKILLYSVVFLGGSPKNTPALYSIMSHIDFNLGVFYPMGGINTIVQAIHKIGLQLGVTYKIKSPVSSIIIQNKKAIGVVVNNKKYYADVIVSNADYPFTEINLLPKELQTYPKSYWDSKTIAPSAFCIYLGLSKKIKSLEHHTLFFANDWEKHFGTIFDKDNKTWPKDPSFYVCTPSKTDPSVAPAGSENLFILVPIASGLKDDQKHREIFFKKIINLLENQLEEDILKHIVYKKIFTISDYKSLYNAYQGTALGFAHNLFQSAIFRPQNRSTKVNNLYYVGQYTVPGVGMPMVLISGKVTANRINKDFHGIK